MPSWRMVTGNLLEGIEVSQRRKSRWTLSPSRFSTSFSSCGIQLAARWQFCSRTQLPRSVAATMRRSAMGPWPWPREMYCSLEPKPVSSAKRRRSATGSAPAVRTKTSGTMGDESSKAACRSNTGGSMNRAPCFSEMKAEMAASSLSERMHRSTHIFWKVSSSASHLPGRGSLSHVDESNSLRHAAVESMTSWSSPANLGIWDR
mmetsp:Transcript_36834/g.85617  ORF Transcript_36834/g.85617 Transcript_36834/m.85617 type:complete len:204 (-) Transcript_36834:523-1134(-)